MDVKINIRREEKKDYRIVETITREAFWNVFIPGCDEHYLVHKLRSSPDFIPELDFVTEIDSRVVANIIYTRSAIIDPKGISHPVITFGPISVLPEFQNKGIGRALIEHTSNVAAELGYRATIIYGFPRYYENRGFRSCKEFGITDPEGKYPYAMLIRELHTDALKGISGKLIMSDDFACDPDEVAEFDKNFSAKEKLLTDSQDEFANASKMYV